MRRKRGRQNGLVLNEVFDRQALRRSRLSLSYRRLQFQGEVRRRCEKDAPEWLATPPSLPRTLQTLLCFLKRQSNLFLRADLNQAVKRETRLYDNRDMKLQRCCAPFVVSEISEIASDDISMLPDAQPWVRGCFCVCVCTMRLPRSASLAFVCPF